MDDDYDTAYFLRREQNARQLAQRSDDPGIRRIHVEMADRYAERARAAPRSMLPPIPVE